MPFLWYNKHANKRKSVREVSTEVALPTSAYVYILYLYAYLFLSMITIAELAKRIKVSVTTINNAMRPLRKNKIIDRTGARKNGTWIVNQ